MASTGAKGIMSAIKATIPSSQSTATRMPAMSRFARARLQNHALPISTLPSKESAIESKRGAAPQPNALQRIASARLGTAATSGPGVTDEEFDNATTATDNALDSIAGARPAFRMGCNPVRDTEVDSLRQKVKGQLEELNDDLGRGNEKVSDSSGSSTSSDSKEGQKL